MNVVFAHPRHVYGSYSDYRRLVLLSGFETCHIDEIDLASDSVYIISPANGEILNLLNRSRRAKVIWWNLERFDSGHWSPEGNNASNMPDLIEGLVDRMWTSDRYYATLDPRHLHVTLGSDARLAEGSPDPMKIYDFVALTYNNDRRKKIYERLDRWKVAPSAAWGETRARLLNTSRAMVYVHQTPAPIGAPLRFALAAAYKLPIISEAIADPFPLMEGRDFAGAPYDAIPDLVEEWLSERKLAPLGENLHQTLCVERNFRSCVEEGVRASFP